jgi:hypothetical protein
MKLVLWMLSGSVFSAGILSLVLGAGARLEVWLGMLGPLVSAVASWIAMGRQYARHPEGLTRILIKAFAAKMIFFAGYVTVLLGAGLVHAIPFAISFLGYFLSLHIVEAVGLHRLQVAGISASPELLQGQYRNG